MTIEINLIVNIFSQYRLYFYHLYISYYNKQHHFPRYIPREQLLPVQTKLALKLLFDSTPWYYLITYSTSLLDQKYG